MHEHGAFITRGDTRMAHRHALWSVLCCVTANPFRAPVALVDLDLGRHLLLTRPPLQATGADQRGGGQGKHKDVRDPGSILIT